MIDRHDKLSVSRQCQVLELPRSTAYYQPQPISDDELALMRRIDELHLEMPYAGARMLSRLLKREGKLVGRKRVATLMQRLGIHALYRKPNTSQRHPTHKIYPYLLRHLEINRSNHVWAADITYIPMRRGFVYLFAVMDWASRRVLSWRLSNTLTTDFCIEAVQDAINRYGRPEIFNTDQGCQFTSLDFTGLLKANDIRISMERLWKSVKYEEIYLHGYDTVSEVRQALTRYFDFHNRRRPHSTLDGQTPDTAYFTPSLLAAAA